jgi:hypothetical protein
MGLHPPAKSVSNEKRIQLGVASREPITQNIGRYKRTSGSCDFTFTTMALDVRVVLEGRSVDRGRFARGFGGTCPNTARIRDGLNFLDRFPESHRRLVPVPAPREHVALAGHVVLSGSRRPPEFTNPRQARSLIESPPMAYGFMFTSTLPAERPHPEDVSPPRAGSSGGLWTHR